MTSRFEDFLANPTLERIRRNHGLEHATIHILNARFPHTPLAGRSDARGFFLFGDVSTEAVEQAVSEALSRLRAGEADLAIHPNCGTNILTAALLAGSASFVSLVGARHEGWRDRLARLPLAVAASVFALILAQPLGTAVQRHVTTQGDPGTLRLLSVQRLHRGRASLHRILTIS
jgi:hypothetical protein